MRVQLLPLNRAPVTAAAGNRPSNHPRQREETNAESAGNARRRRQQKARKPPEARE